MTEDQILRHAVDLLHEDGTSVLAKVDFCHSAAAAGNASGARSVARVLLQYFREIGATERVDHFEWFIETMTKRLNKAK